MGGGGRSWALNGKSIDLSVSKFKNKRVNIGTPKKTIKFPF